VNPASQPIQPLALSQRLAQIIEENPERLSFTDLAAQLHYRAWGALLLIFSSINVLPLPPGTTFFFAMPVLLVAAQMIIGRQTPWFPARLDRRGVTRQELQRLTGKIDWLERRVERIFKPRLSVLTGATAARLIGIACFLLALIIAIPLPLLHHAPATSIALFGLALIYRDGVLVIFAILASLASLVIDALIVESGVLALTYAVSWLHLWPGSH
jgi:hypothetical protein